MDEYDYRQDYREHFITAHEQEKLKKFEDRILIAQINTFFLTKKQYRDYLQIMLPKYREKISNFDENIDIHELIYSRGHYYNYERISYEIIKNQIDIELFMYDRYPILIYYRQITDQISIKNTKTLRILKNLHLHDQLYSPYCVIVIPFEFPLERRDELIFYVEQKYDSIIYYCVPEIMVSKASNNGVLREKMDRLSDEYLKKISDNFL